VRFWLSVMFEPYDQLLDHARRAEELGFEGVIMADHVVVLDGERTPHPSGYPLRADEPFPDPLVTFGAMAAVTTRLRFMTGVLVVPLRDPFLLAKQLATAALLSDNRVVLGTGVGWLREEFETVGRGWSDRGARMDEMLDVMRDFWADGWAEHHGEHYEFARSGMFPVPTAPIPVWIGGHSTPAARRAARFDGYMPMRPLDDVTRREFALVDELRAEQGRTGGFDRIVGWPGGDRSTVAELAERDGITDLTVFAWPMYADLPLGDKHAAAEGFAETVIRG
jgi:probable F420-dependent oxidoreductase